LRIGSSRQIASALLSGLHGIRLTSGTLLSSLSVNMYNCWSYLITHKTDHIKRSVSHHRVSSFTLR